ncbi:MAG: mandelate racemase [Betaproteobacteria bacterium RIFCSPHIGHO2_12_FULL_69_13]|nr:MAG: mandelate racemase [Betaproteobacteria bacterium RIFCSPHIGHO2_12_FULL_69_13]OGA66958.1 MAG: mandelate racemase [Betaproteobacteria bacterium RIFCSPLOWO2_12_FULL_68_20]
MSAPRLSVPEIALYERDVALRLPFRFGAATLTRAPQAFVRARIRLEDGREAEGAAAELLVPKWFDKNPALSDEENLDQLRSSLALARDAYLAGGENTAFGHWIDSYGAQIGLGAVRGLNSLTACFGPALVDRALLDALCRALGVSFYEAIRKNLPGIAAPSWQADIAEFDMGGFLASLAPGAEIAARHTVGLADAVRARDLKDRVHDGLPQTLEEVVARYGHRWYKVKLSGDPAADMERLTAVALVLERVAGDYHTTLDGNEQYGDVEGVIELLRRVASLKKLARFAASIAFIEQPVRRSATMVQHVARLAEEKPVIIDESDDSLEAFPLARRMGYTGVSSKACKGLYKSLINRARCVLWNREEGGERYFMSGEDLTAQAGLAVQQDLALASLLGLAHVERNGHHYVNGMAGLAEAEQQAFLAAHPDLYERSDGAVRLRIAGGMLAIGSLDCPGFASRAAPDWSAMREMKTE